MKQSIMGDTHKNCHLHFVVSMGVLGLLIRECKVLIGPLQGNISAYWLEYLCHHKWYKKAASHV